MADVKWPPDGLENEALKLRKTTLRAASKDLDRAIDLLMATRNQLEAGELRFEHSPESILYESNRMSDSIRDQAQESADTRASIQQHTTR